MHLPGDGSVQDGLPAAMFASTTSRRPSSSWAGWPAGPRCRCRSATRARQAPPCATARPAGPPPPVRPEPPAGRAVLSAAGRRGPLRRRSSPSGGRPRPARPARWSRSWAATARASRRCSGRSRVPGRGKAGRVQVDGDDPQALSAADGARRLVGLVPQTPADLLYLDTVAAELARQADARVGVAAAWATDARDILDRLAPGIADDGHPRDLSEGQRLALVLAVQLSASPPVLLLDEPTRGLDYAAKEALSRILADLAAAGRAVVVSTHDVEFVAGAADRVVVMAEGEIVADGDTTEVIVASPAFAPQVAKVLAPLPYLTVDQVARSLHRCAR